MIPFTGADGLRDYRVGRDAPPRARRRRWPWLVLIAGVALGLLVWSR